MVRGKIAVIVGMTALLALVIAGCCYRTPEGRAEHVVKHLVSTLKLDAAQTEKLEKIKSDYLAKRPEMIKTREETVKEANELMRSAEIDKARLNALVEKSKTHANGTVEFIAAKFVEIHDMLTPEQRARLAAEMEKYASHAHRW